MGAYSSRVYIVRILWVSLVALVMDQAIKDDHQWIPVTSLPTQQQVN